MELAPSRAVQIAPVAAADRAAVAELAAREMRDNAMHVAALGPNGWRRFDVMRSPGCWGRPSSRGRRPC